MKLGNNDFTNSYTPYQLPRVSNVQDIEASGSDYFAIIPVGSVIVWGQNNMSQLGMGGTVASDPTQTKYLPIKDPYLLNDKQISASNNHGLALMNDGRIMSWVNNTNVDVGNGFTTTQYTPLALSL
jgi:alpha-tubulin suppressor-like RCC1 family protein